MADGPRITNLSVLTAENVKFRNTDFLKSDQAYTAEMGYARKELRRQIWVVRNGDIRRVFRQFPTDEPLEEQCALWMHAIVGKHFFPDANHRTGAALLRKLLTENGIEPGKWPIDRLEEVRDESHAVREEIAPVRLDTLYRRDRLYEVWLEFFEEQLDVSADGKK